MDNSSSPNNIRFVALSPSQWRLLHPFYKRNNYEGFPRNGETVAVLIDASNLIIAVARITLQAGERIIRGVWVEGEFRRQGYGIWLLDCIEKEGWLTHSYCFAQPHLHDFYEAAGFISVDDKELSNNLRNLLKRYQEVDNSLRAFYHPM